MVLDCLLAQCLFRTRSHGTQAGFKTYFVNEEDLERLISMSFCKLKLQGCNTMPDALLKLEPRTSCMRGKKLNYSPRSYKTLEFCCGVTCSFFAKAAVKLGH